MDKALISCNACDTIDSFVNENSAGYCRECWQECQDDNERDGMKSNFQKGDTMTKKTEVKPSYTVGQRVDYRFDDCNFINYGFANHQETEDEAVANCALWTAAPALVEAMQKVRPYIKMLANDGYITDGDYEFIRAALKAAGVEI